MIEIPVPEWRRTVERARSRAGSNYRGSWPQREEQMSEKLRTEAARVIAGGPTRVMISPEEAVPYRRAMEEHGIVPDVIFIRDDGWSLGAPKNLIEAAERTWPDAWVGVLVPPDSEPMTYEQWRESR